MIAFRRQRQAGSDVLLGRLVLKNMCLAPSAGSSAQSPQSQHLNTSVVAGSKSSPIHTTSDGDCQVIRPRESDNEWGQRAFVDSLDTRGLDGRARSRVKLFLAKSFIMVASDVIIQCMRCLTSSNWKTVYCFDSWQYSLVSQLCLTNNTTREKKCCQRDYIRFTTLIVFKHFINVYKRSKNPYKGFKYYLRI